MGIVPSPEWEEIIDKLIKNKGIAFFLGATDSGKSTFVQYILKRLLAENLKISIIDTDIGQSTIGLPGTISVKIFDQKIKEEDRSIDKMSFIGTCNPATKISLILELTKKMVDFCKERSDIILIDTTGLISGDLGRELKIGEIKVVEPNYIIAIERKDELEHILKSIDSIVFKIKVSPWAKVRSRELRVDYRKKRLMEYFLKEELSEFMVSDRDIGFYYNNNKFSLKKRDVIVGTLIGLNHNDDTIALGIITEVSKNFVLFKSPIKHLKDINKIIFGDIVIEENL